MTWGIFVQANCRLVPGSLESKCEMQDSRITNVRILANASSRSVQMDKNTQFSPESVESNV